jgi:ADP-dependent NAD(P)H-hydrate dehydratase / NAD(P)H-hydrate epimerase
MKILSAPQIREWDQFTINNEPISSIDLMERASAACAGWITQHVPHNKKLIFFCGSGNNGGDGLAIARLLLKERGNIAVYTLHAGTRSIDCEINLRRLMEMQALVHDIESAESFPEIDPDDVVLEALFGTGLSKPLGGIAQMLVQYINASMATVVSIDMPAGLFADVSSKESTVIKATHTLSFQCPKLAFMMKENGEYIGDVTILDIGLHKTYCEQSITGTFTIDQESILSFFKPRTAFAHKYSFGHALLYAGSNRMMGAAILSAESCLRSGAGLVTVHTDTASSAIIQTALPEAIADPENNFEITSTKKAAIGLGPGLAINKENSDLLKKILTVWEGPLVIDASGLTLLQPLLELLPMKKGVPAVLTPHTGEFEKLFAASANDFEQMKWALQKAAEYNCYIALKGHHTLTACPDGEAWFNTTGNSGMATAGSGDVLTGIITGLMAQGYSPKNACMLGVYLHGAAGDLAAANLSLEAMIAGDITKHLGSAIKELYKIKSIP